MTIVEPVAVAHPRRPPLDEAPRHTYVEISQDDLVQLIRQMREKARQTGQRMPGRLALAQTIGVSAYRVRLALEEIARDQHPSHERSRRPPSEAHMSLRSAGTGGQPEAAVAQTTIGPTAGATPPHQGQLAGNAQWAEPGAPAHPLNPQLVTPSGDDSATRPHNATQVSTSSSTPMTGDLKAPAGARGFYLVAFMSLLVSIDTSWRFFGHILHITETWERAMMFGVIEAALIACGYGMRANVLRTGRPGAPRFFAWLLCGTAGYMAWQLSGVAEGVARVALGPALGLVMLHLALGIEIRATHARTTTWVRVGRELRERILSRLGLSDDRRDALARTRDRAARRVARLSLGKFVPLRAARVARALRASNVAHDSTMRSQMLAELAALRHADDLATLPQSSPWHQNHTRHINKDGNGGRARSATQKPHGR